MSVIAFPQALLFSHRQQIVSDLADQGIRVLGIGRSQVEGERSIYHLFTDAGEFELSSQLTAGEFSFSIREIELGSPFHPYTEFWQQGHAAGAEGLPQRSQFPTFEAGEVYREAYAMGQSF